METGVHELTAAYALDALDPEDRRTYESHLGDCPRCREELGTMWRTAEALALGASGPEPSPDLRERIVQAARAEPHVVVPFERRRSRATPVLGALAAAAAAVALAFGLWGSQVSGDLDDARSALERERATAAILADPAARTIALQKGAGRLVLAPDGRAVLVVDGLDPAPEGKTYEVWIASHEGSPRRAGLFSGADERDVVLVEGTVEAAHVVLVTLEQAGGVDEPTTEPIIGTMPA